MATCSLCPRGSDAQRVLHIRTTSSVGLERSTVHRDCRDAIHRACSRTRPRAARGNTRPSGPHPSCADSDWACQPDIPLQPLGRADSLQARTWTPEDSDPCARPAMTDPGVSPFDPPGLTRGPRTSSGSTTRVPHLAYNASPGRTLTITALSRTYSQRYSCQTNSS